MKRSLAELAQALNAQLHGDPAVVITGVASLGRAGPSELSFLSDRRHVASLADTRAGAVLMTAEFAEGFQGNALVVTKPHVVFARAVSELMEMPLVAEPGISPYAVVSPSAQLGRDVAIGPFVVIEADATIGDGVTLGAHSYVGRGVRIGAGSVAMPRATLHADTVIGERAILHSGCVIGDDGFGYAKDGAAWIKVPQVGHVVLGNDVEIGANTTVDCGAIDDTVIGDGVKIDNQVQIGHNVVIGKNTIIAGCVGIAGSARIGERCAFGGQAGVLGHLEIADDVTVAACSLVTKSIKKAGVYSSSLRVDSIDVWQKNAARLYHLDRLAQQVRDLERKLENRSDKKGSK